MNTRSKMHVRRLCSALGALLLSTSGCEMLSTIDRSKLDTTTSSAGGGGTGGGTTSSTGTGGSPECAVASDCADPGSPCLERACTDDGRCVPHRVALGTPLEEQQPGDCQRVVCDGLGATASEADDADLPSDGNECTDDLCTAGAVSHPNRELDTPCGQGGALYCDSNGACVGCTSDAQCGAPTDCATPRCTLGACGTDFTAPGTAVPTQTVGDCQEVQCNGLGGTKSIAAGADITDDGNECTNDVCVAGAATHPNAPSGTACGSGGTRCDGAGDCVECLTGADCTSLVCTLHVCIAATCADKVKNATETDQDCGGGQCAPCADGKGCAVAGDCTSSVCSGTPLTCQAPTCTDMIKNGTESDVNCGGGACPACGPTMACLVNADCKGGSCVGNTCVPTCTDTVKNGAETDIDCGGLVCGACADGKMCSLDGDCSGGVCAGGICTGPTCTDNLKNALETDVDCGGGACPTCADGKTCVSGGDCASGHCTSGTCRAADDEPVNNTCAGASPEPLPATVTPLQLPTVADVDWFVFTATAADVGKVVHVITQSSGSPPCDTVVEVFEGASCAALTSLGGPSDDADYSEDWLSAPLTAAGSFWVNVSYSSFGFSSPNYTLLVSLQ